MSEQIVKLLKKMSEKHGSRKIVVEINTKTIVKVFVVIAGILLLVYLRTVFLMFVVAFILMSALRPAVDWLAKRKVPRSLAVFMVFLVGVALFGTVLYFITPPLVEQVKVFVENFPDIVKSVLLSIGERFSALSTTLSPDNIDNFFEGYRSAMAATPTNFWSSAWNTIETAMGFAGSLISVVMGISLAVYMVIERNRMVNTLLLFFSNEKREHVSEVISKVESKVGAWLRGQLVLCLIIGLVTWLVLTILQVKYAVALGVLAGVLEIIPVVGPIVAAVPVVITAFSLSPWQGIGAFVATIAIQQLENALLVPVVMKRAVGLNPVVTLLAILVGSRLFDVVGAIIAVPFAGIITVLVDEYLASRGIIIEKGVGKGDKLAPPKETAEDVAEKQVQPD